MQCFDTIRWKGFFFFCTHVKDLYFFGNVNRNDFLKLHFSHSEDV